MTNEHQFDIKERGWLTNLGKAEVDRGTGVLKGSLFNGFGQDTRTAKVSLSTDNLALHFSNMQGVRYLLRL
jgi:hypothetical protein